MRWAEGQGVLDYKIIEGYYRCTVEVEQDLVDFYYSLIPKYLYVKKQAYKAHISVVRREVPLKNWGKYQGKEIEFLYSRIVYNDDKYWWLDVLSLELEEIRLEMGLINKSIYTPPDCFNKFFHITLGNCK